MPMICNENFTQEKQFYTSQRMTIQQIIRRNDGDVEMKVRGIWFVVQISQNTLASTIAQPSTGSKAGRYRQSTGYATHER